MARNLQGLNVVHPVVHNDSHDLLAGQYPDLTAQLDLWTNLAFEDEAPLSAKADDPYARKRTEEEEEEAVLQSPTTESAMHDGHINVVTAREQQQQPFYLNALLSGFGIDPFHAQPHLAPSLAQLLALHASPPPVAPPAYPVMALPREEPTAPPQKRSRTRKASVSTSATATPPMEPHADAPTGQVISAAEDKRRRNTAASARFRLKKKEREAALEAKAKELEQRVNELERECEGLRRENGWLKGLVVGVTGAAQAPAAPLSGGVAKRGREED
ncbi:hypothetical protein C0989_001624 [Termitomyces sp. Mn162]|nr:hypothetical protein C0989_001624 [Termitomyces sp. Mn162]